MSTAQTLKGFSLQFLINLLCAQKVKLVLLQRILIAFSFFYKHDAMRIRL